jgi:hypothetical protein
VPWFLAHPDWRLVHAADALVFAHAPLPPGVVEIPRGEAWRLVLRQADLVDEQNDLPAHTEYTRAVALLQLGERDRAAFAFERGVRRAPALAGLYRAVGQTLAASGR